MKYECNGCLSTGCKVELPDVVGIPTHCVLVAGTAHWHKVTAPAPKPLPCVSKSAETATQESLSCKSETLPKLTVEVFDREDCPEWAKYAIVAPSGKAYYTSTIPSYDTNKKAWGIFDGDASAIPGKFNASDWQHSLIERPEKKTLPDFKNGDWVYNSEFGFGRVHTPNVDGFGVVSVDWFKSGMRGGALPEQLQPAHIRPWTFEEAPLAFKTKDDVFILLYIQDKQEWGYWAKKECEEYTLAEVAKEQIQIDGSPCGVLEIAEVGK